MCVWTRRCSGCASSLLQHPSIPSQHPNHSPRSLHSIPPPTTLLTTTFSEFVPHGELWCNCERTDVIISFTRMLTWTFPALACAAASFIGRPAGSTFQLQWFGEERSSKDDAAFHHQPSSLPFPCDTNSSAPPATSVHQLRPQDVEICAR